jgi:hypothetical protein
MSSSGMERRLIGGTVVSLHVDRMALKALRVKNKDMRKACGFLQLDRTFEVGTMPSFPWKDDFPLHL